MASGDGPPARNTRFAACNARNVQTREEQSVPPSEGAQSNVPVCTERPASREGSALTSLTGSLGDEQTQSEENDAPSEHGTIHEQTEEIHDQEQSYTTAPGSFGPSMAPSAAQTSKGKRHIAVRSPRSEDTLSWDQRASPPHLTCSNEDMGQLREALSRLTAIAEENRVEVSNLQHRVAHSYNQTTGVVEAMQTIQRMIDCITAREEGRHTPPDSPRAIASRAIFTECGSNEGTIDYECRQNAQARFEAPLHTKGARAEQTGGYSSASSTRAGEGSNSLSRIRVEERTTPFDRFNLQMTES